MSKSISKTSKTSKTLKTPKTPKISKISKTKKSRKIEEKYDVNEELTKTKLLKWNTNALRLYCQQKGIRGYSGLPKVQLVNLIIGEPVIIKTDYEIDLENLNKQTPEQLMTLKLGHLKCYCKYFKISTYNKTKKAMVKCILEKSKNLKNQTNISIKTSKIIEKKSKNSNKKNKQQKQLLSPIVAKIYPIEPNDDYELYLQIKERNKNKNKIDIDECSVQSFDDDWKLD